jgi:hypothetical protein
MNPLHVDKEINSLWLICTLAYTGYTQWIVSIPFSVKLLPSLQWMADFRNTRNSIIPWSTQEGHSFLQRFSQEQNSTPFPHGTEHILSEWLKAFPQSDFGNATKFLQISEWQIEQEKSHIHAHTETNVHTKKWWYLNCYLVKEFLNFYLVNSHVEQVH